MLLTLSVNDGTGYDRVLNRVNEGNVCVCQPEKQ